MQEVIEEFRYNVPQEHIPNYNKDWHSYCQFCDEITDDKCVAAELNPSDVPDPKQVFHTLVSNILRHEAMK
jgi:hypothetical protein